MRTHGTDSGAEALRQRFVAAYPERWRRMLTDWQRADGVATMWLMYAANYLFCTRGVRWAIDPFLAARRLPDLAAPVPLESLRSLSFALLTHGHADHLDLPLLAALRGTGVRIVLPEHLHETVRREAMLPETQLTLARPGRVLELAGLRVLPFPGMHWEMRSDGRRIGVEAVGYQVTVGGEKWVFPGDVRTYEDAALQPLAPADILFAHLWLGRSCAEAAQPPLLGAFCRFLLGAAPRRVILTHLHEFGRSAPDLWLERHAAEVQACWETVAPGIPMIVPNMLEACRL